LFTPVALTRQEHQREWQESFSDRGTRNEKRETTSNAYKTTTRLPLQSNNNNETGSIRVYIWDLFAFLFLIESWIVHQVEWVGVFLLSFVKLAIDKIEWRSQVPLSFYLALSLTLSWYANS